MNINSVLDGLIYRRLAVIQDEMSDIVSILKLGYCGGKGFRCK